MRVLLVALLALACLCAAEEATVTDTVVGCTPTVNEYCVSVAEKTASHPLFGQGSPFTFVVNGRPALEIAIAYGSTVTFATGDVSAAHALYISTSATGAGAGEVTNGVVGLGTAASPLTWSTQSIAPGDAAVQYYYQCRFHSDMGFRISLVQESTEVTVLRNIKFALELESGELDDWTFAGDAPDVCTYGRITCDESGSITELHLSGVASGGVIAPQITELSTLRLLRMENNALTGNVPPFADVPALHELHLSNNALEGGLSYRMVPTSVRVIDLAHNQFSGSMFLNVDSFTELRELHLNDNDLSGGWPTTSLLALTEFTRMDLSNNNFYGPLPALPHSLEEVSISNNGFTGFIDSATDNLLIWNAHGNAFACYHMRQQYDTSTCCDPYKLDGVFGRECTVTEVSHFPPQTPYQELVRRVRTENDASLLFEPIEDDYDFVAGIFSASLAARLPAVTYIDVAYIEVIAENTPQPDWSAEWRHMTVQATNGFGTHVEIDGLAPESYYHVQMRSCNSNGCTPWGRPFGKSAERAYITAPNMPTVHSLTVERDTANTTWTSDGLEFVLTLAYDGAIAGEVPLARYELHGPGGLVLLGTSADAELFFPERKQELYGEFAFPQSTPMGAFHLVLYLDLDDSDHGASAEGKIDLRVSDLPDVVGVFYQAGERRPLPPIIVSKDISPAEFSTDQGAQEIAFGATVDVYDELGITFAHAKLVNTETDRAFWLTGDLFDIKEDDVPARFGVSWHHKVPHRSAAALYEVQEMLLETGNGWSLQLGADEIGLRARNLAQRPKLDSMWTEFFRFDCHGRLHFGIGTVYQVSLDLSAATRLLDYVVERLRARVDCRGEAAGCTMSAVEFERRATLQPVAWADLFSGGPRNTTTCAGAGVDGSLLTRVMEMLGGDDDDYNDGGCDCVDCDCGSDGTDGGDGGDGAGVATTSQAAQLLETLLTLRRAVGAHVAAKSARSATVDDDGTAASASDEGGEDDDDDGPNVTLPDSCTYEHVAGGGACLLEMKDHTHGMNMRLAVDSCGTDTMLPYVSLSCGGSDDCYYLLRSCEEEMCGEHLECTEMNVGVWSDVMNGVMGMEIHNDECLESMDATLMGTFDSLIRDEPFSARSKDAHSWCTFPNADMLLWPEPELECDDGHCEGLFAWDGMLADQNMVSDVRKAGTDVLAVPGQSSSNSDSASGGSGTVAGAAARAAGDAIEGTTLLKHTCAGHFSLLPGAALSTGVAVPSLVSALHTVTSQGMFGAASCQAVHDGRLLPTREQWRTRYLPYQPLLWTYALFTRANGHVPDDVLEIGPYYLDPLHHAYEGVMGHNRTHLLKVIDGADTCTYDYFLQTGRCAYEWTGVSGFVDGIESLSVVMWECGAFTESLPAFEVKCKGPLCDVLHKPTPCRTQSDCAALGTARCDMELLDMLHMNGSDPLGMMLWGGEMEEDECANEGAWNADLENFFRSFDSQMPAVTAPRTPFGLCVPDVEQIGDNLATWEDVEIETSVVSPKYHVVHAGTFVDVPGDCTPQCDGRECGPSGCGSDGVCGHCSNGFVCSADFMCEPSFVVTVAARDGATHPNDGDNAAPVAYYINGVQAAELNIKEGEAYSFLMSTGVVCEQGRGFAIFEEAEGGSDMSQHTESVDGSNACDGSVLVLMPTAETPDTLFYGDRELLRMGWRINIERKCPNQCGFSRGDCNILLGECVCDKGYCGDDCSLYTTPRFVPSGGRLFPDASGFVATFWEATNAPEGTCDELLGSVVADKLGRNATCEWASATQLQVFFGDNPTIERGSHTVQQHAVLDESKRIRTVGKGCEYLDTASFYLVPPEGASLYASLVGANVITPCMDSLPIEVQVSVGDLPNRELEVTWTLNNVDNDPEVKPLVDFFAAAENKRRVIVPTRLIPEREYLFLSVQVRNWFGDVDYLAMSLHRRNGTAAPLVRVAEGLHRVARARDEVSFTALVSHDECGAEDREVLYDWTSRPLPLEVLVPVPEGSEHLRSWSFPPYSLRPGQTASVDLTVEYANDPSALSVSLYATVEIVYGEIHALIKGGDRSVRTTDTFVLDGSDSFNDDQNPNDPTDEHWSTIEYAWSCPSCPLHFTNNADRTKPTLTVPAFALPPGRYPFTLSLSQHGSTHRYTDDATVFVTVVSGDAPTVEIATLPSRKHNPLQDLRLESHLVGNVPASQVRFQWEVTEGKLELTSDTLRTTSTGPNLVVRGSVLTGGITYTFKLTATNTESGESAFATISVLTNNAPSGGATSVEPVLGYSLNTTFVIDCANQGWQDDLFDLPLQYRVEYTRTQPYADSDASGTAVAAAKTTIAGSSSATAVAAAAAEADLVTIRGWDTVPIVYTDSVVAPSKGSDVWVRCRVRDTWGSIASSTWVPIQVLRVRRTPNELRDTLDTQLDSLSNNDGSVSDVLSLLSAVAEEADASSDDTGSGGGAEDEEAEGLRGKLLLELSDVLDQSLQGGQLASADVVDEFVASADAITKGRLDGDGLRVGRQVLEGLAATFEALPASETVSEETERGLLRSAANLVRNRAPSVRANVTLGREMASVLFGVAEKVAEKRLTATSCGEEPNVLEVDDGIQLATMRRDPEQLAREALDVEGRKVQFGARSLQEYDAAACADVRVVLLETNVYDWVDGKVLNDAILSIEMKAQRESSGTLVDVKDLEEPFVMRFPSEGTGRDGTVSCRWFDETSLTFSSKGCWVANRTDDYVECACVHMTDFVVTNSSAPPAAPNAPTTGASDLTSVQALWEVPPGADFLDHAITSYDLEWWPAGTTGQNTLETGMAITPRSFTIDSLSAGDGVVVRVRAVNAVGVGEWSDEGALFAATAAPDAPAKPTVAEVTTTTVRVAWVEPEDNGEAITRYDLQVRESSAGTFASVCCSDADATEFTVTGLSEMTSYTFRVAAINAVGASAFSAELEAGTETDCAARSLCADCAALAACGWCGSTESSGGCTSVSAQTSCTATWAQSDCGLLERVEDENSNKSNTPLILGIVAGAIFLVLVGACVAGKFRQKAPGAAPSSKPSKPTMSTPSPSVGVAAASASPSGDVEMSRYAGTQQAGGYGGYGGQQQAQAQQQQQQYRAYADPYANQYGGQQQAQQAQQQQQYGYDYGGANNGGAGDPYAAYAASPPQDTYDAQYYDHDTYYDNQYHTQASSSPYQGGQW